MIRADRPEDLVHLPEIERAAGVAFRDLDMCGIPLWHASRSVNGTA